MKSGPLAFVFSMPGPTFEAGPRIREQSGASNYVFFVRSSRAAARELIVIMPNHAHDFYSLERIGQIKMLTRV